MLTIKEVEHIAELARIGLSQAEKEKMTIELSSILDYVGKLKELDTKNVTVTSQVTGLINVSSEDGVESVSVNTHELLLANMPLRVTDMQGENQSGNLLKVKGVFE